MKSVTVSDAVWPFVLSDCLSFFLSAVLKRDLDLTEISWLNKGGMYKWGNILWRNGVHSSSRVQSWSCSGGSWRPDSILRHFMLVFPFICHPSVVSSFLCNFKNYIGPTLRCVALFCAQYNTTTIKNMKDPHHTFSFYLTPEVHLCPVYGVSCPGLYSSLKMTEYIVFLCLWLLFNYDVRFIRSRLFDSELLFKCPSLNRSCFQWLNWTCSLDSS